MAAIFIDGFEIDFTDNTAGIWTAVVLDGVGPTVTYSGSPVRTGSGSVTLESNTSTVYVYLSQTITAQTEIYLGFGFYWHSSRTLAAAAGNIVPMITLASSTGAGQVMLGIDVTSNLLKVYKQQASGTLLGTGTHAITSNTMTYVEMHVVISDTVGVVDVRVNTTSDIALTAQDTNTAGGDIVTVMAGIPRSTDGGSSGGAGKFTYDDFIINDTTGTVSNSWPNGAGIEKLVPNADGNYTAWTSTGGAVDYTEIDDVTTYGNLPDDDTTTILSSTTGQRTSVGLTNTALTGSVEAVMLLTYAKNSAAGADQMSQGVRIGSTDYDSTAFVPATTYGWQKDILTLNPATSARWLTSEIDGMEHGFYRVT